MFGKNKLMTLIFKSNFYCFCLYIIQVPILSLENLEIIEQKSKIENHKFDFD